jgi:hypothetical protein
MSGNSDKIDIILLGVISQAFRCLSRNDLSLYIYPIIFKSAYQLVEVALSIGPVA